MTTSPASAVKAGVIHRADRLQGRFASMLPCKLTHQRALVCRLQPVLQSPPLPVSPTHLQCLLP